MRLKGVKQAIVNPPQPMPSVDLNGIPETGQEIDVGSTSYC